MQSQVTFVEAVGVAPGTTSMMINGAPFCTRPDLNGCMPDPLPIHVLPDQSTWAAYKGNEPARWRGAWMDPASGGGYGPGSGSGFGLMGEDPHRTGTAVFQLLFGVALGYAMAYASTKAYRKWKTR